MGELIRHDETMCMGVVGGCACICSECDESRERARELWRHRPRSRDDDGLERLGSILSQLIDEVARLREGTRTAALPHPERPHTYKANRAPMDSDKQRCLVCNQPPDDALHLLETG